MNFCFSVLGLISPLLLEYQQLFYISVAPSQSLIFMELHELISFETRATKLKLYYLFQVVLHIQITKATKLKGEKSLFVFATEENVGFTNPGHFSLELLTG